MTAWEYPFDPHPKQELALKSSARETLYGGAVAGGKSEVLLAACIDLCVLVPGAKALLVRRTTGELRELKERLRKRVPKEVAVLKEVENTYYFRNGSMLIMAFLDSEEDATKVQGFELQLCAFDELTHYDKSWYAEVVSRLRATGPVRERMDELGLVPRALSASNPGGRGHCVPYGEVLTPAGWADITTMRVGDPVYAVDPSGALVPSRVEQVHRHKAPRTVEVNGRGTHMHVTPEHKVAKVGGVRGATGSKFSLVPWQDLPGQATILRTVGWEGADPGPVTVVDDSGLRKSRTPQTDTLTAGQYAELMGWFLSEGSLVDRDQAISIAQMKQSQREHLKAFLDDCGFTQSWSAGQVIIYARAWWKHFKDLDLGLCRDKFIPQPLKDATRPILERLFVALMDGDGHWHTRGRSGAYYTTSQRLADDVAEVAVKLGYIVQVASRQRENRHGLSWQVNFKTVKSGGTEYLTGNHVYKVDTETKRRSDAVVHDHERPIPVYCIGVPEHHAFVIRQQGSVWVSGNSWVKERFVDPAPMGVEYDPPGDEGGRRLFIQATLYDNPFIDHADYIRNSLGGLDPERKRALLEGDWSIPAGVRFPQFRESVHTLAPEDFPIDPVGIVRTVGVDFGFSDPYAAVWLAKVGEYIIAYRDDVKDELTAAQQAARILDLEDEGERAPNRPVTIALDPAAWRRDPNHVGPKLGGEDAPLGSMAWHYQEVTAGKGGSVVKGINDRIHGWATIDDLLLPRETGAIDPETGEPEELPRLLIYNTCRELIKALQSAPRDKRRPEDLDTKWKDDHVCFTGDTLVATEGGECRIDSIRAGDLVWTRKGLRSVLVAGRTAQDAVVGRVEFSNGTYLEGTADHPVFLVGGSKRALGKLKRGAVVSTESLDVVTVVRTWQATGRADVYNLSVAEHHEYYANGILVSNCDALRYGVMELLGRDYVRKPTGEELSARQALDLRTETGDLQTVGF